MTPEQYEALFGAPPSQAAATTAPLPVERRPEPVSIAHPEPTLSPEVIDLRTEPAAASHPPPVQVAVYNNHVQNNVHQPVQHARTDVPVFYFDGGAATYVGTAILGSLITIFTLGICYPFAVVLRQRWQAKHTYIQGRRLMFTGSAVGLFGNWIKWLVLMIVTLGIYSFWVIPRIVKWKTENLAFDPTHAA